jgi:DNA-binding response OmpR family regulator
MSKILVIDDDKDFQEFICYFLQSSGYETASAFDAEEGIRKVGSENPDLVILDVMMPSGLEGFTVARKVREELNLVELPIIMLTAVHQVVKVPYRFVPDDQWLPVDRFLDKPVDPNKLLARIRELLPGEG